MEFRETLDTGVDFRQWLYGNGLEAKYSFAMARTPRGLEMAPPDIPLAGKTSEEKRREIEEKFGVVPPHLTGFQFSVEFVPVENNAPIWVNQINIDTRRVVEMHFSRSECKLEYQPIGRRFYWRPITEGSDRDEGDLSAKDALRVFAGVGQVAIKYYRDNKPDGIILATREDSKESRGKIYKRIADRFATEEGAIVASIDPIRRDMKRPILIWFPKVLR